MVEAVTAKDVAGQADFVGRTEASQRVDVRARVSGTLLTRPFEEGHEVEAGAVLFEIDPAEFQANLLSLPEEVKRQSVTTEKKSTSMLMVISVFSPEGTYDDIFLSNYSGINLRDTLARVGGVASVEILGARDYGMRIWLEPDRLTALGLMASDVIAAIRDQNIQASPGAIGQQPAPSSQQFQYTLTAQGRLQDVSQFEDIILVANSDGSVVELKDVARVELGAENYGWFGQLNGKPAALLAVYQLPDANALDVAGRVRAEMDRLADRFPNDLAYQVTYDTTLYVETSIREVIITLLQALALVVLVVFVFLQDWRSTLIPAAAAPSAPWAARMVRERA